LSSVTSWREIAATLIIVGLAVGFVTWRAVAHRFADHPSAEECAALLDRYVEHRVWQFGAHDEQHRPSARELARSRDEVRARAARDPEFALCAQRITRDEADCAMRAGSADEFERCLP